MKRYVCLYPFNQITISYDGKVIACNLDWPELMEMGSLKNDSLLDIYYNQKYESFRYMHANGNPQYMCEFCGGVASNIFRGDIEPYININKIQNITESQLSFFVVLELSLACTCICKHCVRSKDLERYPTIEKGYNQFLMKPEMLKLALSQLDEFLKEKDRTAVVMLHWRGESFLNPLIGTACEQLISNPRIKSLILDTNLQALTKDKIFQFLKQIKWPLAKHSNFDFHLSFSLDATNKDSYDKIRIGGDFELAKANALAFLEQRNALEILQLRFSFQFIVEPYNWDYTQDFINYWESRIDIKLDDIYIKRCHGRWEFTDLIPKIYSKTIKRFKLIEQAKKKPYLTLDIDENKYFVQKENSVFKYED